jgi:hypothetical protein
MWMGRETLGCVGIYACRVEATHAREAKWCKAFKHMYWFYKSII